MRSLLNAGVSGPVWRSLSQCGWNARTLARPAGKCCLNSKLVVNHAQLKSIRNLRISNTGIYTVPTSFDTLKSSASIINTPIHFFSTRARGTNNNRRTNRRNTSASKSNPFENQTPYEVLRINSNAVVMTIIGRIHNHVTSRRA